MKHVIAIALAIAASVGLSACGSRAETVGTVGGAALGGAVGSSVVGGTLGTIGGAAAGGYIGHELGQEYDKRNR
jgi:osmotically inducible lipoprotein OsmB